MYEWVAWNVKLKFDWNLSFLKIAWWLLFLTFPSHLVCFLIISWRIFPFYPSTDSSNSSFWIEKYSSFHLLTSSAYSNSSSFTKGSSFILRFLTFLIMFIFLILGQTFPRLHYVQENVLPYITRSYLPLLPHFLKHFRLLSFHQFVRFFLVYRKCSFFHSFISKIVCPFRFFLTYRRTVFIHPLILHFLDRILSFTHFFFMYLYWKMFFLTSFG